MSIKNLLRLFLFVLTAHVSAQQVRIIDFWTEMPLAQVSLRAGGDSLLTGVDGMVDLAALNNGGGKIILHKTGYYKQTIRLPYHSAIIKLTPIEDSPEIEIVSEALGNPALMTPTHVSLLKVAPLISQGIRTLDQLLMRQAGVFVKSYGPPGQLQGISLRGMGGEQTQFFVDGIPVNNMQLGTADPGQYDLSRFEQVEVYRGGNPRLGSSGSIGGAINLKSREPADSLSYHLGLRWQSLQNSFADLMLTVPVSRLRNELNFTREEGQNAYSVDRDGKRVALRNRDFQIQRLRYRLSADLTGSMRMWGFVDSYRQTGGAPAEFQNEQTEQNNRARLAYDNTLSALAIQYFTTGLTSEARAYVRNDWNEYSNPGVRIAGDSIASLHFNHEMGSIAEARYLIDRTLFLHGGIEASRQSVRSTDSGDHQRRRLSAFIKAEYEYPIALWQEWRLQVYGSLRGESYSTMEPVLLPAAGVTIHRPGVKIYLSAGKNFRVPTFNELYWQPGGNPDLRPEKSLNAELGTELSTVWDGFKGTVSAALYTNRVSDQIVWTPVTTSFWSPQNVLKVNSTGLELQGSLSDQAQRFTLSGSYHYGRSVKTGRSHPDDPTIGKLVPYLPLQTWSLAGYLNGKYLTGGISASGSSFRYLSFSNDPYDMLPSYWLARLWIGYEITWQAHRLPIGFSVNNVLDKAYQVMPGRPMPGRSFEISFRIIH